MTDFAIVPASRFSGPQLEACFLDGFSGYLLGPIRMPPGGFDALVAIHGIDLDASRVAADMSGNPQAFAFATPRPERHSWRLAAMAAAPAARGRGVASALLDDFISRAKNANCERVELECFAQNDRARQLYKSRGFEAVHELHGWDGVPRGKAPREAEEVPLAEALGQLAAAQTTLDLPFQATAASLRAHHSPLRAWRCGSALAFVREVTETLFVPAMLDMSPGQQDGCALARVLAAVAAGKPIRVPQILRDDVGGLGLQLAGLQRAELHQLWMMRQLVEY